MRSSQEQHCSTHTSQVTSKKSLHMQDLWAPQKTAVHLASPSKADGTALARRLVLGASSPHTALPLLATHGWGRATSHSLGGSIKRWRLAHAGKDAAALCFFPTLVFFHSCPSLLHTSSMPRPRVGTDRFHAPGGKATALASGLIHTTLGRATLLLPGFGTKLAHKCRWQGAVHFQKSPCCPAFQSQLANQLGIVASNAARHHGKSDGGSTAQLPGM